MIKNTDTHIADGLYQTEVIRERSGTTECVDDVVAQEVPVAMVYNGISHVVMMATPQNLDDFALGFSLSEGICETAADMFGVDSVHTANGIELQMDISERCFQRLKMMRRNMTGRTGCGLCGAESLQQAIRLPPPVADIEPIASKVISRAMQAMAKQQPLNQATGAVHAAAWSNRQGEICLLREDVGRHNALDKLIGALATINRPSGFLLVTSRASYEMVQKAGWAKAGLLAAISAPTSLAIELAQQLNITLLGFVRDDNLVVYANRRGVAGLE